MSCKKQPLEFLFFIPIVPHFTVNDGFNRWAPYVATKWVNTPSKWNWFHENTLFDQKSDHLPDMCRNGLHILFFHI